MSNGSARVVGIGVVSAYGVGKTPFAAGLSGQRSAAHEQLVDGVTALVARVPDSVFVEGTHRLSSALLLAAREATTEAIASGWRADDRTAVIHSTGIGDILAIRDSYFTPGARTLPSQLPSMLLTAPASIISAEFGAHGPNTIVNAACASTNMAIGVALDWMRSGRCSSAIVTCAEFILIRQIIDGFRKVGVCVTKGMSDEVCRPFSDDSQGFILGEGAIAFVLTKDSGSANPYGSVLGTSNTHDGYHLVAPDPTGLHLHRAYVDALRDANMTSSDVRAINTHGAGTRLGDKAEMSAILSTFRNDIAIASTKPLHGHCMAASSGVELAALLVGRSQGQLFCAPRASSSPPTFGARQLATSSVVANTALGLGGYNSVVIIGD